MLKLWRKRPAITVGLSESASQKIHDFAKSKHPIETGGLLLGWWEGENVAVVDVIEVLDKRATHTSWIRREKTAQLALDQALVGRKDNAGYVGDWHTHPAAIGASTTDLLSLRRSSRQYDKPTVLVVRKVDRVIEVHAALKGKLCRVESFEK